MTIVLLILIALALLVALLFLTIATNEFEKSTRSLSAFVQKRYIYEPPKKAADSKAMQSLGKPGLGLPGAAKAPSP